DKCYLGNYDDNDKNESACYLPRLLNINKNIVNTHKHCDTCKQSYELYDRCIYQRVMYHGRSYKRRDSINSYTIAYHDINGNIRFGYIEYFINCKCGVRVKISELKKQYSFLFHLKKSKYYDILSSVLDYFFTVVDETTAAFDIDTEQVWRKCIIYPVGRYHVITPLLTTFEHD
ncbi:unnamed protein product, partial [Didymodactylos carnosus]